MPYFPSTPCQKAYIDVSVIYRLFHSFRRRKKLRENRTPSEGVRQARLSDIYLRLYLKKGYSLTLERK